MFTSQMFMFILYSFVYPWLASHFNIIQKVLGLQLEIQIITIFTLRQLGKKYVQQLNYMLYLWYDLVKFVKTVYNCFCLSCSISLCKFHLNIPLCLCLELLSSTQTTLTQHSHRKLFQLMEAQNAFFSLSFQYC